MQKYETAPNGFGDSWQRWVEHGIEPGSFGMALLKGDLFGAATKADHINRHLIAEHAQWILYNLPVACFGSAERCEEWKQSKRGGKIIQLVR